MKLIKKCFIASLCLLLCGCGASVRTEDYEKWAEENGYIKIEDSVSSATEQWAAQNGYIKVSSDTITSATDANTDSVGFNYGDLDWSSELQTAALKDFLRGRSFTDTGVAYGTDKTYSDAEYTYTEMYQVATVYNGAPQIATAEYYFNVDDMMLFAGGEQGTGKLLQMEQNNKVSLQWTRQLRYFDDEGNMDEVDDIESENSWYNYYRSYGVTLDVEATILTQEAVDNMDAETKAKVASSARGFYHGIGSRPRYWSKGAKGNSYCKVGTEDGLACSDDEIIEELLSSTMYTYYYYDVKKVTITVPLLMYLVYSDSVTELDHHSEYVAATDSAAAKVTTNKVSLEPGKCYVADATATLHLQDGNPYEFHMIDTRPYNAEGDTFFKAAKEYVESQISGGITSSGKLLGEVDGSNVYTYGTPLNYFNIKIVGTPEGEKIGLKTQTSYYVE